MRTHLNKLVFGTFLVLSVAPALALAQVTVVGPPTTTTTIEALLTKVCVIVNIMFTVLLIAAVIMVIFAAFKYLTAGGEAEKVTEANHDILYAAIAVAIGIFAKVVPVIVANFFTTGIVAC